MYWKKVVPLEFIIQKINKLPQYAYYLMYYKQGERLGTYFEQNKELEYTFQVFQQWVQMVIFLPELQDKGRGMRGSWKATCVSLS